MFNCDDGWLSEEPDFTLSISQCERRESIETRKLPLGRLRIIREPRYELDQDLKLRLFMNPDQTKLPVCNCSDQCAPIALCHPIYCAHSMTAWRASAPSERRDIRPDAGTPRQDPIIRRTSLTVSDFVTSDASGQAIACQV